jgi:hypothetical protein
VPEAIERTDKFLDQAVLSELREVRVIHGHGTGQLRRALTAFLAEHPQVVRVRRASQPGWRRRHGRGAQGLMALFPQSFLDDLRLKADIVQVVQETVSLRRVGGTYKGLCPFHNEKTPSFHVDRERGFFHCFGCGVGGNVFKFVELHERLSFPKRCVVAKKFGVALPETGDARHDPNADAERRA